MKMIVVKDYQEMSKKAAEYLIAKVRQFPSITLGLATGETPLGMYRYIVEDHQKNGTSYRKVTTFNLDEYVGLSAENKNSYRYYMNDVLFHHIDIKKTNIHIPRGDATDLQRECNDYEKLIEEAGGIDLQVLGIGSNGHIGFNEPGTSFDSKTHIVNLTYSTIKANARFFNSINEVPTQAITMGISTIMKSREILLLISGESKKEALKTLWNTEENENFPASVLKHHPHVMIIADEAAAANMSSYVYF
jgi:glucosamine-6-phosphate deaminase